MRLDRGCFGIYSSWNSFLMSCRQLELVRALPTQQGYKPSSKKEPNALGIFPPSIAIRAVSCKVIKYPLVLLQTSLRKKLVWILKTPYLFKLGQVDLHERIKIFSSCGKEVCKLYLQLLMGRYNYVKTHQ